MWGCGCRLTCLILILIILIRITVILVIVVFIIIIIIIISSSNTGYDILSDFIMLCKLRCLVFQTAASFLLARIPSTAD